MQKKNLLFAAGLMLLAACSEDIQPGTSDNGGLNFTGEGEMLVELNREQRMLALVALLAMKTVQGMNPK